MVEDQLPLQSHGHDVCADDEEPGGQGRILAYLQGVHDSNFPFGPHHIYQAM